MLFKRNGCHLFFIGKDEDDVNAMNEVKGRLKSLSKASKRITMGFIDMQLLKRTQHSRGTDEVGVR